MRASAHAPGPDSKTELHPIIQLQRAYGNRRVAELIQAGRFAQARGGRSGEAEASVAVIDEPERAVDPITNGLDGRAPARGDRSRIFTAKLLPTAKMPSRRQAPQNGEPLAGKSEGEPESAESKEEAPPIQARFAGSSDGGGTPSDDTAAAGGNRTCDACAAGSAPCPKCAGAHPELVQRKVADGSASTPAPAPPVSAPEMPAPAAAAAPAVEAPGPSAVPASNGLSGSAAPVAATAGPTVAPPQPAAAGAGRGAPGQPAAGPAPAGEAPASEAKPAAPGANLGSAEGLLGSLASVPASSFGESLNQAKAAAHSIQSREKSDLAASFPEIDQPTGLPVKATPAKPGTAKLAPGQAPAPPAGGGGGAVAPEAATPVATGPLPASKVSTAAAEPADDSGGSWWDWLFGKVRQFFAGLPTRDAGLSTSAGDRPSVDLTGDADPAKAPAYRQESGEHVTAGREKADAATTGDFGEKGIYPTVPTGKMRPGVRPSAPKFAAGRGPGKSPALPADARAQFDEGATPGIGVQVREQAGQYEKDEQTYQKQSQQAREDGERRIAEETERTRTQQQGLRGQAQTDVESGRGKWREENRKTEEEYGTKSSDKQKEIDTKIQDKVKTANKRADEELTSAETKAAGEREKAEAKAAAKKQEAEDKPKSWWERVKGAVSDAFDAIRDAINDIFDELRKAVKTIIDTAKKLVRDLIDAARDAIVGMIHEFGEFVKGLVTIALAAFPETAAKVRAWIDGKVKEASDAVNRAAEALKTATDAILDAVGKALDTALNIMQAAFNAALDALEFIGKLVAEALEAVAKLVELLKKFGAFLEGAKKVLDNPGIIIDGIKDAIGGMIAGVPAAATAKLQEFAGSLGGGVQLAPAKGASAAPPVAATTPVQRQADPAAKAAPAQRHVSASEHMKGILRHLEKGLAHLKTSWWEELKKVGWNLLWPWPAVWTDIKDIWKEIKSAWADAADLKASKVIDSILTITQKVNSILGNLYGWFFIASVLIGAIIGAFFGGVGAIPGALAGAAFAGEVGEALVVALLATESAVIVKAVADLAIGNDAAEEDEKDYDKIAGSTMTIAITVTLMLLGEIAAKLAKSIWEGVAGVFKGEKPEVNVKVEEPGKAPAGEKAPEIINGERVVASEPTPDGHEVKVTEEGKCLVCSTCEEIQIKYKDQLEANTPEAQSVKAELEEAKKLPDGPEKAKAVEKIEEKLEKMKAEAPSPAQMKIQAMQQAGRDAAGAIKDLKDVKLRSDEVGELRADPAVKKELGKLEADVDALERQRVDLEKQAKEAADAAKDPDLADLAAEDAEKIRQKLDDLKTEAEKINKEIDRKVKEHQEAKAKEEATQRAAEEKAERAKDSADNICDETDGTNRPDASIGDGSTEAVLREEVRTGEPIKSPEGHWIKTDEAVRGLEKAIKELNEAKAVIKDPAKLKAIEETLARANDRLAKLKAALKEWNERAKTHPDVFNPDGSSKKKPDWP